MAEKAQINFQVNEKQRKRWKQAAEEDMGHNSMSQFIRTAVEEKITDDGSPQKPQTGPEIGKILERLDLTWMIFNRLSTTLTAVSETLNRR